MLPATRLCVKPGGSRHRRPQQHTVTTHAPSKCSSSSRQTDICRNCNGACPLHLTRTPASTALTPDDVHCPVAEAAGVRNAAARVCQEDDCCISTAAATHCTAAAAAAAHAQCRKLRLQRGQLRLPVISHGWRQRRQPRLLQLHHCQLGHAWHMVARQRQRTHAAAASGARACCTQARLLSLLSCARLIQRIGPLLQRQLTQQPAAVCKHDARPRQLPRSKAQQLPQLQATGAGSRQRHGAAQHTEHTGITTAAAAAQRGCEQAQAHLPRQPQAQACFRLLQLLHARTCNASSTVICSSAPRACCLQSDSMIQQYTHLAAAPAGSVC